MSTRSLFLYRNRSSSSLSLFRLPPSFLPSSTSPPRSDMISLADSVKNKISGISLAGLPWLDFMKSAAIHPTVPQTSLSLLPYLLSYLFSSLISHSLLSLSTISGISFLSPSLALPQRHCTRRTFEPPLETNVVPFSFIS